MVRRLIHRLNETKRRWTRSFGMDISTPGKRLAAWLHFQVSDFAFLRVLWTNQYQIAPGVWRSNQPSPARLRRLHRMGIRTILNLRGAEPYAHYLFEKEACDALGIELVDLRLSARKLVPRAQFMAVFEAFDQADKPLLLHCKSGADRAGLVSALWLLDQENASIAEARKMMGLRYLHLKRTHTGVLDAILDHYEADTRDREMPIRDWMATRYDPHAIAQEFYPRMGWPVPAKWQ